MAAGKSSGSSRKGRNTANSKQSRKFAQKGHLARAIKERKQRQNIRNKIDNRKALRAKGAAPSRQQHHKDVDDDDDDDAQLDEDGEDGEADSADEVSVATRKFDRDTGKADRRTNRLDDETLQALLAEDDSDDDKAGASLNGDDEEDSLADLEGVSRFLKQAYPMLYLYLVLHRRGREA